MGYLSAQDHDRVAAAIRAAEAHTSVTHTTPSARQATLPDPIRLTMLPP